MCSRLLLRFALPAMMAGALLMGVSPWARADSGDLDSSFGGGDGIAMQDFAGNAASTGRAVIVQPNGRIVIAGETRQPTRNDTDFGIARFLPGGDPDPDFGTNGVVMTNFRGGDDDVEALLRQADGKIVAVGESTSAPGDADDRAFALARYVPTGKRDPDFSGDGRVVIDFANYQHMTAFEAAVGPGGKIVVVGYGERTSSGTTDMLLARLRPNGSLDTTFSGDGRLTIDPSHGGDDGLAAVALQSDGKIVAAGWADTPAQDPDGRWCVIRLQSSGQLDTNFSGDGIVIRNVKVGEDDHASDVLVLPSRRILAVGRAVDAVGPSTQSDAVLLRLEPGGAPDTSFGTDGLRKADFGGSEEPFSVARDGAGRLVMGGRFGGGLQPGVLRTTAAGAPDTTFDGDGLAIVPTGFAPKGHDIAVQANDRPVVVGSTAMSDGDMEVARFLA